MTDASSPLPSAEKNAANVTDEEAIAYLDRVDPHGTRSLSSILWAREQVAAIRATPPTEPCEDCGGTGRTVQGWTDKSGEPEDQYGPCSTCVTSPTKCSSCGRPLVSEFGGTDHCSPESWVTCHRILTPGSGDADE